MATTAVAKLTRVFAPKLVSYAKCRPLIPQSKVLLRSYTLSATKLANDRYFTKDHEWVTVDGGEATVGISDHAQTNLGEIVFVQLPDVSSEFSLGEECGALESVKAASDIICPLSGKVFAKNSAVEDDPTKINQSPYDDGWLFKLEMTNTKEVEELMNEDEYHKFLKEDD
ncbi:DgyrCDS7191 [Dimorphilus gyrociliatus]|uniref:Glycine cleavage system H protein n=1 Tax=Dimorphilus gyrociliatus TaxID=2664684 RepID=A0A7I8VQI9_9ANNE|nr:DgyrCDS7191 [Dimorphilus gyrociliatus]